MSDNATKLDQSSLDFWGELNIFEDLPQGPCRDDRKQSASNVAAELQEVLDGEVENAYSPKELRKFSKSNIGSRAEKRESVASDKFVVIADVNDMRSALIAYGHDPKDAGDILNHLRQTTTIAESASPSSGPGRRQIYSVEDLMKRAVMPGSEHHSTRANARKALRQRGIPDNQIPRLVPDYLTQTD